MKKGIDVSVWQGNIDWAKASKEIDFAIIRAGYGKVASQKDKKFEQNYLGCKNNNVKIGAYWFSYAKTISDASQEAAACIAALKGKNFDYPIWYDVEDNGTFKTGKNNVSAITRTFCEALKKAGYQVGIYSSRSGLETYFTDEVKKFYDVWVANVAKGGGPLSSTSYKGHTIWQYSWKGKVNGISGDVDMNYCYKDYVNEKPVQSTPVQKQESVASPPSAKTINVSYLGYINGKGWSKEVKNENDFLGTDGRTLSGFTAQASEGKLKFRVHTRNGKWLGWIDKYNCSDWNWGVAGVKGKIIDGIQMDFSGVDGYTVMYRVSVLGTSGWYPWVSGYGNGINGYAGLLGKPIDKIQVKIVKK